MFTPCIKSMVCDSQNKGMPNLYLFSGIDICVGPVVRVGPDEVDVTDLSSIKAIHTVKATYIKSPRFYRALSAPGVESVFSTTDVRLLSWYSQNNNPLDRDGC